MRGVVCALVLAVAGPAAADEPAPEPTGAAPKAVPPTKQTALDGGFLHKGQFELSVRVPIGLRAIATYDSANYCGKIDVTTTSGFAPVCTGRAPFSIDLELGYGIARRIDLLVEMRIGLEQDFSSGPGATDGPHPFHLSPGARFFFSEAQSTKLFTTAQVVFDFSGYKSSGGVDRGSDYGVRNLNGMWFDLDKAYGFYVYVGDTLTLARWMRFELEAGIGFQGRYR